MNPFKIAWHKWQGWGNDPVVTFHGKSGMITCILVVSMIALLSNLAEMRACSRDHVMPVESDIAAKKLHGALDQMYADELLKKLKSHTPTPFDDVISDRGAAMGFALPDESNVGTTGFLDVIYNGAYLSVVIYAENKGEVSDKAGRVVGWRIVDVVPSSERKGRR